MRAESDATYVFRFARSKTLRARCNRRSSSSIDIAVCGAMRACRITGMASNAVAPSASRQIGTSRQQSNSRFCPDNAASRSSLLLASSAGSTKIMPAASGTSLPMCISASHKAPWNRACGKPAVIPAPSPLRPSAAIAPRCARRERASSPICRSSWHGAAEVCTIKPTPQESCSNRGSYKPCCTGCRLSRKVRSDTARR